MHEHNTKYLSTCTIEWNIIIYEYSNGGQFGYKAETSSKFREYTIQKSKGIEILCQIWNNN